MAANEGGLFLRHTRELKRSIDSKNRCGFHHFVELKIISESLWSKV